MTHMAIIRCSLYFPFAAKYRIHQQLCAMSTLYPVRCSVIKFCILRNKHSDQCVSASIAHMPTTNPCLLPNRDHISWWALCRPWYLLNSAWLQFCMFGLKYSNERSYDSVTDMPTIRFRLYFTFAAKYSAHHSI